MNLIAVLQKIGLSQEIISYFSHAFLLPAVMHEVSDTVTITISNDQIIPASIYEKVLKAFTSYLNKPITLIIESTNGTINSSELVNYIHLFSELNNISAIRNLIPRQSEDLKTIVFDYPEATVIEKLGVWLHQVGVKAEIISGTVPEENETTDPLPAVVPISTPENHYTNHSDDRNERPFFRNSQKAEIDKTKYLAVMMRNLTKAVEKIKVSGLVFQVDYFTTRSKKEIQRIYFTDYTNAAVVKRFENRFLSKDEMHEIDSGNYIEVYGNYVYDDFDRSFSIVPDNITVLPTNPFTRTDEHQGEKRMELHAHTNKSEMDGISECRDMINRAYQWGWNGIAIVDNAVVQAFPDAQAALLDIDKKHPDNKFKVIFGIEMSMAEETLDIVYNATDEPMKNLEYAVIDLETTGLSARYDHIIEFGGAIVKNGLVTEKKQLFVKSPIPVPPFIRQKCAITDDMLKAALPFTEAASQIIKFIGDRVIVAHNAAFDFNFLNEQLRQHDLPPLTNACIDTLNLARQIIPNRKFYRLGLVANNYNVEYDEDSAHRGDYDADVLAQIFTRMVFDIPNYPDLTLKQLQLQQSPDIYKKARPSHVTILAKDMAGIKDIYELVSLSHTKYLTYFAKENAKKADSDVVAEPRIIRREIAARKAKGHILVGAGNLYSELFELAANRSQQALEQAMSFYDYVEVQPVTNYRPAGEEGSSFDDERIKTIITSLIDTAKKLNLPVIADNDAYYIDPSQKIGRDIYIMAKRIGGARHPLYPLNKQKRLKFVSPDQHLMTTDEMIKEFDFLGFDTARNIVIDNPAKIVSQIEKIYPIVQELLTPDIPGSAEKLTEVIYQTAHDTYGDPLPEIVAERIKRELTAVIDNGRTVQYYIAHLLVKKASEDGFIVGSRGSVGSSFIATMAKITEVNPLVPHYICPKCHHSEFITDGSVADGFDLPDKNCPVCGTAMYGEGHDIPFETFMGFGGDKVPDIDLNFPQEYQEKAQLMIKDIFGDNYAFRAGTIGTVAAKTAFGYIKGYCEETEKPMFSDAYATYLSSLCENVKRTTGQHPAGIVVIPKDKEIHDFTPIQYPANNPFSRWQTTHFAISDLHDNILKLDILGHVDPSAVKMLQDYTGIDPHKVPMNDAKTLSLFSKTEALGIPQNNPHYHETIGAAGLPEFGTHNSRRTLETTKPSSFSDLVILSGLAHGTDVWANNQEQLFINHVCTLKEVIGCRDDIMRYLIHKELPSKTSFDIMESVRHGRGLKPEWIELMKGHDVPQWYIDACQKIGYMFPKAHAVAYVTMAVRIAWFKVYYPAQYYATYFSLRCDAFELTTMLAGEEAIYQRLTDIQKRMADKTAKTTSQEDKLEPVLEVAEEMYLRGYHLNNLSVKKSESTAFIVDPDDPKGVLPAFTAVDSLGANIGNAIVSARKQQPFISINDFKNRGHVTDKQLEIMRDLHVLDDLDEENQLTFDL